MIAQVHFINCLHYTSLTNSEAAKVDEVKGDAERYYSSFRSWTEAIEFDVVTSASEVMTLSEEFEPIGRYSQIRLLSLPAPSSHGP